MPIPTNFKWASGKSALMGSLAEYLVTHIPDESFEFDNPILPLKLPSYGVTEKGLYNLGSIAMDDFLGYKEDKALYGKRNQTLIEISAWDDETVNPQAVGKVRQMRDKIVYLLYNAGRQDENGLEILPPIRLYNYYESPKKRIGIVVLDPADNSINEKFVIDPINQNIKVYRLLIRMFWYEYLT